LYCLVGLEQNALGTSQGNAESDESEREQKAGQNLQKTTAESDPISVYPRQTKPSDTL
jgi:hypothetical protein